MHLPAYSGKQIVRGDFRIFSSKRSFLFRKRMIEVSVNHLLLQIESNNFKLSCIRFCKMSERYYVILFVYTNRYLYEPIFPYEMDKLLKLSPPPCFFAKCNNRLSAKGLITTHLRNRIIINSARIIQADDL